MNWYSLTLVFMTKEINYGQQYKKVMNKCNQMVINKKQLSVDLQPGCSHSSLFEANSTLLSENCKSLHIIIHILLSLINSSTTNLSHVHTKVSNAVS